MQGNELNYIAQAVETAHISGDGPFTKKCERLLEQEINVAKVLLTTSCTHAIEMAALLLDVKPGDEVIVPSFTFVSSVNPFVLRGAKPIFIDIRRDTLNLDEAELERHVTPRTKAIVPVHYAGVGCEMDTISEIAERNGIAIVEDNAHGLFGKYNHKNLGTFGCLAALSFHETKNITCGEGGALLINELQYVEPAEIIREKGTDRSRFFRGKVDKYTWVGLGSSYVPSDILAAFLYAQLEARDRIQSRRKEIWKYYFNNLQSWARDNDTTLPTVPAHCEQSYHLFYLVLPTPHDRDAMIRHLKAHGIDSVFHYVPLHLSEMGRRFGGTEGDCPVTEDVSARLLRLPFYNGLSDTDQAYIVETITQFKRG
jgi:dTDP-4-amino-4,6-dideoxygalactose transaminase